MAQEQDAQPVELIAAAPAAAKPAETVSWRKFPEHVERVAAECAKNMWSDEPFTPTGKTGGSGSTAIQVKMSRSNLLAWAKPARVSADSGHHVAFEKIAADIAHALQLPVAPVILSKQTAGIKMPNGTAIALPSIVALSYETLAQPKPWNELQPLLTPEQTTDIKTIATVMRVFHALICDNDHGGIGANAQIERGADGVMRANYYDHSNSLSRAGWNPPAPAPVGNWATWQGDFANPDKTAIDMILAKITNVAGDKIKGIIRQIPDECLPQTARDALMDAVHERCGTLRDVIKL